MNTYGPKKSIDEPEDELYVISIHGSIVKKSEIKAVIQNIVNEQNQKVISAIGENGLNGVIDVVLDELPGSSPANKKDIHPEIFAHIKTMVEEHLKNQPGLQEQLITFNQNQPIFSEILPLLSNIVSDQLKMREDYLDPNIWYQASLLAGAHGNSDPTLHKYKDLLLEALKELSAATDDTRKIYLGKKIEIYFAILARAIKEAQLPGFSEDIGIIDRPRFSEYMFKKEDQLMEIANDYQKADTQTRYRSLMRQYAAAKIKLNKTYDALTSRLPSDDQRDARYLLSAPAKLQTGFSAFWQTFVDKKKLALTQLNKEKYHGTASRWQLKHKINQEYVTDIETNIAKLEKETKAQVAKINGELNRMQELLAVLKRIDDHIKNNPRMLFGEKKQMLRELQAELQKAFFNPAKNNQTIGEIVQEWQSKHNPEEPGNKWHQHITNTQFMLFSAKDPSTEELIHDLAKNEAVIGGGEKKVVRQAQPFSPLF